MLRALALAVALTGGAAHAQVTAVIEADTTIREAAPVTAFGADPLLGVDNTPGRRAQALLRARVGGIGTRSVVSARLRLRVAVAGQPGSDAGGSVHVASCAWTEGQTTWATRPAIAPVALDALGRVRRRQDYDLDVTSAVTRDGVYCFALVGESPTFDDVRYEARESGTRFPSLVVTTGPPATTSTTSSSSTSSSSSSSRTTSSSTSTSRTTSSSSWTSRTSTSSTSSSRSSSSSTSSSRTTSSSASSSSTSTSRTTTSSTLASSTTVPSSCLGRPGPYIQLTGTLTQSYGKTLMADTTIDARTATFLGSSTNAYPLTLGGDPGVCVVGGTIQGVYDRSATWDQMHDANNAGVAFKNSLFIVDGTRIDNVTDGIRPRSGGGFVIRNVWMSWVRDDCIENDHLQDGLLEDSLLDGCYSGFSARPSPSIVADGYTGVGKVWTIRRSLVRLQPMPGPDGSSTPEVLGHGPFFKWDDWDDPDTSLSPKVALHDNVFLAERAPESGSSRLGIPPGQLASCSNNTMVWLGQGPFPTTLPSCFAITTNRSVWDTAVQSWHTRHGR